MEVAMSIDELVSRAGITLKREEFLKEASKLTKQDHKKISTKLYTRLQSDLKNLNFIEKSTAGYIKGSSSYEITLPKDKSTGKVKTIIVDKNTIKQFKDEINETMKIGFSLGFSNTQSRRTSRKRDEDSGFNNPSRCKEDIIRFMENANLGPYVEGVVSKESDEKSKNKFRVEGATSVAGSRINDYLLFTKSSIDGVPNKMRGYVSHSVLTTLFALHIYYSKAQHKDAPSQISCTAEMREYLYNMMKTKIQKDYEQVCGLLDKKYGPESASHKAVAYTVMEQCIKAIKDPSLEVNSVLDKKNKIYIFNPNNFLYHELSSLISLGKEDVQPNKDQIAQLSLSLYNDFRNSAKFKAFFDSEASEYKSEEEFKLKFINAMERVQRVPIIKASSFKDGLKNVEKDAKKKENPPKKRKGKQTEESTDEASSSPQ
jgi:hypothetical protein